MRSGREQSYWSSCVGGRFYTSTIIYTASLLLVHMPCNDATPLPRLLILTHSDRHTSLSIQGKTATILAMCRPRSSAAHGNGMKKYPKDVNNTHDDRLSSKNAGFALLSPEHTMGSRHVLRSMRCRIQL